MSLGDILGKIIHTVEDAAHVAAEAAPVVEVVAGVVPGLGTIATAARIVARCTACQTSAVTDATAGAAVPWCPNCGAERFDVTGVHPESTTPVAPADGDGQAPATAPHIPTGEL